MEKRRGVEKLLSILDLTIGEALNLPESLSTRVMLAYDGRRNKKEFTVLGKEITGDMKERIRIWLEENVDIDDVICNLESNHIDGDRIYRARRAQALPVVPGTISAG
jgi:hypothetical protein